MNAQASDRTASSALAISTLVVVAAMLAYANSFRNDFVWDDASSILMHEHVKDPSKAAALFLEDQHAFGRGQGNFYRPLVSLSFLIDYQIATGFGAHDVAPFVFHLTNLAWHIAASLGFLAVVRILGAPALVAVIAPLLYVVHPLHTEAVTYISGRADPMAAALMFAGVALALRTRRSVRGIGAGILALVCFTAALLCKESAMIFPVLLGLALLAQRALHPAASRGGWLVALASLIVLGVYGALRTSVFDFGSDSTVVESGLLGRLNQVVQAFGAYIRLVVWPTNLHMERSLADFTWLHSVAGAMLLGAMLAAFVAALMRRRTFVALGLAWFIATWLPISGIFPLNAPMAEHWLYVPLAGLLLAFMSIVEGVVASRGLRPVAFAAAACAGLVFIGLTLDRNDDWRDNETLFRSTLEQNPNTTRVHFNLAVTYEDLLGNVSGARRHYQRVLDLYADRKSEAEQDLIWEEEMEAHLSLGNIYRDQGRYDVAAQHYQVLTGLDSTNYRPYVASGLLGLGQCMLAVGDPRAVEVLQRAVDLEPGLRPELIRLRRDLV